MTEPVYTPVQVGLGRLLVQAQKLAAVVPAERAEQLQEMISGIKQTLAMASSTTALVPVGIGADTAATTDPASQQTYVSAPAVGAIAIVAALVGAAGGYAGRGYVDKKRLGSHEAAEEKAPKKIPARKKVVKEAAV